MAYTLLATTGMVRGEVIGLRRRDVDFDDQALSIVQTITTVKSKLVGTPRGRRSAGASGERVRLPISSTGHSRGQGRPGGRRSEAVTAAGGVGDENVRGPGGAGAGRHCPLGGSCRPCGDAAFGPAPTAALSGCQWPRPGQRASAPARRE